MNKKILVSLLVALAVVAVLAVTLGQKQTRALEETTFNNEQNAMDTTKQATQENTNVNDGIFSLSTNEGVAPLMIELTPQYMDMQENWIDFGDGTTAEVTCAERVEDTDQCEALTLLSHTFVTAGTYTVNFMSGLKSDPAQAEVVSSKTVTVE